METGCTPHKFDESTLPLTGISFFIAEGIQDYSMMHA